MFEHILKPDRYADLILQDSTRLGAASLAAGLDAPVETCPGWRMRELLRHLGHVHRWARRYLVEGAREMLPEDAEVTMVSTGPADPQLADWVVAGGRQLAAALREAPQSLRCWTFLPAPSPLLFWARRQANETAIHRVDGELAAGVPAAVPADLAADGIDEILLGFASRHPRRLALDRTVSASLEASDSGDTWFAGSGPDGFSAGGGPGEAAGRVKGRVSDLYLLLWNRIPAESVELSGSREFLKWWQSAFKVTWE